MSTVPITISNATITNSDGTTATGATIAGDATLTGLGVDGGPIEPDTPPPTNGEPIHPIWGPPGITLPGPGYPPVAGHPLPPIPPVDPSAPPQFLIPVWTPSTGWIVIPGFPVPTPSGKHAAAPGATQMKPPAPQPPPAPPKR